MGDRDRDQEAGEHADQHGDEQRLLVVAEEVDGEGGDQLTAANAPASHSRIPIRLIGPLLDTICLPLAMRIY